MLTIGQQKLNVLSLLALIALTAATAALSIAIPGLMPWSFLALGVAALALLWSARGDVTLWVWLWTLSYALLDWPSWKVPIPDFFTMSVPRFIFVGMLIAFGFYFLMHHNPIRLNRALLWMMLLFLGYCAISATVAGWTAHTPKFESAPYYRFLEPLLWPFIVFWLIYNTVSRQEQITRPLVLLTLLGWFSLYISYMQYASIVGLFDGRAYIWPPYVNDPTQGIHFDRARGTFLAAGPQALLMVLLFFVDLFLIRKVHGLYRGLLIAQAVLTLPAIFFTGLRAGYVSFLVCGFIWLIWANRLRFGLIKLGIASLVILVGVAMFWGNLAQTNRQTGGVAQREPIFSREVLALQTWEIVKSNPVVGVGFGHFVDAQQALERDPSSEIASQPEVLVEHNLFLGILAETGVVGLALLVAVFVLLFRQSLQLYRKLPAGAGGPLSREFVVLFWVAMANLLTVAMFQDLLWDVFSNALFWSLAGLVTAYNHLLERPAGQPLGPA